MQGPGEPELARAAPASQAGRPWLAFVTERPVAITMFVVAIAVFGAVSLGKLPIDLMPEISYPSLTVRTTWPGAAPEDVEDRLSERVQEALSTLPNLVRSSSISRAEVSDVVLEFEWRTPMTFAVQDVREKLDGVFLPEGAERPLILRYDPNLDPFLRIGVTLREGHGAGANGAASSTAELVQLRWIAEKRIERELEAISGVAAVQVRGGLEEEIRVLVDPNELAAQNLDPALVAERLAAENLNASGGRIREGSTEYLVRTLNEFSDVAEIADLAVVRRGSAVIRVRDIATVERGHAEREVISRIGGREAVEIAIYREAGANIVELAERVNALVFGSAEQRAHTAGLAEREQAASAPGGASWGERDKTDFLAWRLRDEVALEPLSDQSIFIRAAIDEVKNSAVVGALLAIAVIALFLKRLAPTLIVGISIPISIVVTFAPMFLSDVSLNLMSLGGLALGVGMLVDNAIVVIESIARCREEGDDLARAAVRGVREVAGAITASTLTTVSVFVPIIFVHGVAGQIFGDQALTVVASLLVSLLVAVLFIPMLASRPWLSGARGASAPPPGALRAGLAFDRAHLASSLGLLASRALLALLGLALRLAAGVLALAARLFGMVCRPLSWGFDALWHAAERTYPRGLELALRHSWIVLLATGLLGLLAASRVAHLGTELLPEIHQGEFTVFVTLDVGKPLAETDRVLGELERSISALEGVELVALTAGVEAESLSRDIEGKHTGRLNVRLTPAAAADAAHELALEAQVEALVSAHPAVALNPDVRRPTPFAYEPPLQVEVLGFELDTIEAVARDVALRMQAVPGIREVKSSARSGHPELRIVFDRDKTLEYGLDLSVVSRFVRNSVLGNVATRFNEGEDKIDVRVIGDEAVLSNLERVLDLVVNPSAANPVRLRSIAEVERVQGPAEIRRIGHSRAIVVTAKSAGLNLGGLTDAIGAELADLRHPEEVSVELGGQKREMEEAQASMRFALFLAIFLVYVVMACQFESLVQPLVILVAVPLAGIGVVFALELLEINASVIVFIGLIMLAGIVVNNAIVLLDRINQRRAAGVELDLAIVEAGRARLRPILMTTATTVLGLLPLTGWLGHLPLGALAPYLGAGAGAELRAPLAVTVIAGLSSSTLLTLFVIPAVYYRAALASARSSPREARP